MDLQCSKRICDGLDRISELPDEILEYILSFLSVKEAARTSVLSSRWRYLWTFFAGKMDFFQKEWRVNWGQLVSRINQIMKLNRSSNIHEFIVALFDQIVDSVEDTDHWIEFALKKRAKNIQLIFRNKDRRFVGPTIRLPSPTCSSFESLRTLWLENVAIDGPRLNYFLSDAPNLEKLYLYNLIGLSKLLIPNSCLRLKQLAVLHCSKLSEIEILVRRIESFLFEGFETNIKANEFDQLGTLWFGNGHRTLIPCHDVVTHLHRSLSLRQLTNLTLNLYSMEQYRPFSTNNFGLPMLEKLQLIVGSSSGGFCTLNWVHLLEATPVLHTLEIMFYWNPGIGEDMEMLDGHVVNMRLNRSIKVLKIVYYFGLFGVDTLLVKTLIDNMESLEKLIIVPYCASPKFPTLPAMLLKKVNKLIAKLSKKRFLPAGVELVIEREFNGF